MNSMIVQLLSMSLQAVLIIAVIFGIRQLFALAHISKKYVMMLWMIPFFFLVFPWKVSVPGGFWKQEAADFTAGWNRTGTSDQNRLLHDAVLKSGSGQELESEYLLDEKDRQKFLDSQKAANIENAMDAENSADMREAAAVNAIENILSAAWAAGVLFFVLYGSVSYWRLKRKVLCSVRHNDSWDSNWDDSQSECQKTEVYFTDGIQTPIVLGYLKPRIYLPADMDMLYRAYVTVHENTHIQRKDYLIKAAAYFITCLHWFNPAVWLAYNYMAKDIEMACDEEAVSQIGMEKRKGYAAALLELSVGNGTIFTVPPAFGEGDIKERIKNIMNYKKTVKTAAAAAAAVGIFLIGIFLTANESGIQLSASKAAGQVSDETKEAADQEDVLTFEMVREAFARKTAGQMDFQMYSNGEKQATHEDAQNYLIDFSFTDDGEAYHLLTSYDKRTDQLEDIHIVRSSDEQFGWIYSKDDEGDERYPYNLEVFLNTKTKVEDWLTVELTEGYTLGPYKARYGDAGGALIFPEAYETEENTSAPEEWRYAGFIGKAADPSVFVFKDGVPDVSYFPKSNHSDAQPVGVMDSISPGSGWSTIMVDCFYDLYTSSGLYDLEQSGVDINILDARSEYWNFYFVKEGEQDAYYLSLSAKLFDKSEAIAVARTVKITEDEAVTAKKKTVQDALDLYFADFLNTMLADSSKDYGREDFAGINGYIAAKWLVSTREMYKNGLGGIQSVDFTETELLQMREEGGQVEALADVSYQYAWGDGSGDNVTGTGCLFRVLLEQTGGEWQVVDLEACDCVEVRMLKERMEREGVDEVDGYQFVDAYFGQMWKEN